MSELSRRFVLHLRRFIGDRRGTRRANVRLKFTLRLEGIHSTSNGARRLSSLEGHTMDVSKTGVGLIVPAIRIGEHYLAGAERRLRVSLELPERTVEMLVAPVRYEALEEGSGDRGYVIGTHVLEMSTEDRTEFQNYVKKVLSKQAT